MTTGSVAGQLMIFAVPLFLSNLLQAVYNMVDMIIVGNYVGSVGLAAVSVGGDIQALLEFLSMGFSTAGQIMISQYIGANQRQKITGLIGTMFSFLALCAAGMSILCFLLRKPILTWLNTPPEAWNYAYAYALTCMAGLIFTYGYNAVSAILRGMGDSKRPFLFIAIAAVLNVFLDLLFVTAFHLEVFGAALATVLSQSVSFLCSVIYLYRRKEAFGFDFRLRSFRIDPGILKQYVALGVPLAIQTASVQISKMFVSSWINSYGYIITAVTGIANKLNVVFGFCTNSIMTGGAAMIGQNIGAKEYKRVSRVIFVSYAITTVLASLFSVVLMIAPTPVFRIFTEEESVLKVCLTYIPVAILMFFGNALRTPNSALINGSGNSRLNLSVALLDGIIARIGLGLLLGLYFKMGYEGFWYGNALAGFVPFFIGSIYLLSGRWKKE